MDSATEQAAGCQAQPTENHRWLLQLVGDWTYASDAFMGPDQPRQTFHGTERVRALGELWILGEGSMGTPGEGEDRMLLTLGYDPAQQCFVGSWIGSMMTHHWTYTGQLDAARKVLTLDAEGPDMSGAGGTAKYQDIIELDGDKRVLRSRMLGADGQWLEFMVAHYTRVK